MCERHYLYLLLLVLVVAVAALRCCSYLLLFLFLLFLFVVVAAERCFFCLHGTSVVLALGAFFFFFLTGVIPNGLILRKFCVRCLCVFCFM